MENPADIADSRVIIHADFDSYYVQVEMKRLGIPRETPCAVQQWEGLIAVNYPARDRGITRHMRVKEAKKACPELVCVHVETIGADGSSDADALVPGAAPGDGTAGQESRRLTQKACLERYRRSTAEVLVLLHRLAPTATIEKASIDEVYMDVTAMVDRELQGRAGVRPASVDAFAWGSVVIGGPLDVTSEFERRLAVGAGIACRLRGALLSEMGYTASAGVAANKLLAKVGSAMHKPNQQTVIPPRSVQQVMQTLPLGKLRGFGGKLGEQLEALGCTSAGQVQQLPHATLVAHFGAERAAAIEQQVRGVSHEPVQERERPKSMLAAKSFNATSDLAALHGWFKILAHELAGRMEADEVQFRRRPKNLVVHYRGGAQGGTERSKSCAMPRFTGGTPGADAITEAAFSLFRSKCASEALPCSRLAIAAADFSDLPATNGSAITRFLVPKSATTAGTAGAAAGAAGAAAGFQEGGAGGCNGSGGAGTEGELPAQAQAEAAVVVSGQQPTAAQGLRHGEQQQQQQQQQQQHQHQQQTAVKGRQGPAAGPGPSISSLFERAQKRQRMDAQQGQGQQRQAQQQQGQPVQGEQPPQQQPLQQQPPQQQDPQEQGQRHQKQKKHGQQQARLQWPPQAQRQGQDTQQQPQSQHGPSSATALLPGRDATKVMAGSGRVQLEEPMLASSGTQVPASPRAAAAAASPAAAGAVPPGEPAPAPTPAVVPTSPVVTAGAGGAAAAPTAVAAAMTAAGVVGRAGAPALDVAGGGAAAAAGGRGWTAPGGGALQAQAVGAAAGTEGEAESHAATGPDAEAGAAAGLDAEAEAGALAEAEAGALSGVNVEEQKRILRDIHMLQRLSRSKPAAGPNGGGSGSSTRTARPGSKQQQQQGARQRGISAFFSAATPPGSG